MRKCYMMLVAMVLTVLCATTAYGQRIYQAEIDASFFKAWTSCEPGATEVANPDPIDVTDEKPEGTPFACDNNLYKEVGDWTGIYGSSAAYYLWYADLTGTQKIYFKGSVGFKFWVQFNRQAPTEGGDGHGGNMDQTELTIGEDGTAVYDCSSLEYVHLNCIKTKGSGIKGRLTAIVIEGTVKPVSGFMTMIGNGDAEDDDVSSFPVSWDGPNNGGTANDKPEIVEGGVDGSKCFKVKAFGTDDVAPSESWHTQFYIKSDEVLPKGTKWILKMSMKADQDNVKITTSAQAQPRTWKGGMGIEDFYVGKEWQDFTWSGEIGVDDFQSIAIDLNNGDEVVPNTDNLAGRGDGTASVSRGITFYFDNIEFGVDLGSANPASDITGAFGGDVIEVSLSGTNIPALVRAADGKKVVLPNDCVEISWNGKAGHPISVEGRPNGNLYIFMLDVDGDEDYFYNDMANDVVKIAFKNPADEACRLLFTDGKWEGEPVPDFSGLVCKYNEELADGTYQSYIWGAAELESIEPEAGSFNLGADVNTFTLTFNQKVEVATVNATLGKEKLTASAAEEFSNVITLTRTATTALDGENDLTVTSAKTDRGYDLDDPIVVNYSFGVIDVTSAGEVEVKVDPALFQDCAESSIPAGYYMNFNGDERLNPSTYGSGPRMFKFADGGDFIKGLYFREGYLLYGTLDEYPLTLEADKKYTISFNSAQWKDNGVWMKFDIFTKEGYESEDEPLYSEMIQNTPNTNGVTSSAVSGSTETSISFTPEAAGDYVLRWTSTDKDGNQAYSEVLLANVSMKFIPSLRGLEETLALNAAMEAAKAMREAKNDPRYAGTAYTTLDNLITEYDGKTLTAPSVFAKVTEDLKKATKALNDHADLCDAYDALPSKAFDLYESKKGTKFEPTEYFQALAAAVNKYCTFAEETIVDEETGEEHTAEVLQEFVVLYEDDALTAAKNELNSVIDQASKMLSEGQSHNWYGGGDRTYGYAALHERLRRGVELLKKLGVEEDANVIQAANAELGDNDEIAEAIMRHATSLIMGDLASENSQLFAADEESEEVPSYDLTVFLKNPNIYCPANSTDLPGWVAARGNVTPFPGWGAEHNVNTAYAEDCQIHAGWHPSGYPMVQQTIENLPAGIYTIHIDGSDNNSEVSEGTYGYIKLSDTPDWNDEEGDLDPELHFAGYVHCSGDIEDVEITDGQLTIGFSYGPGSQAFINEATITLTAPATGYDYADAYKQIVDGVETAKTAKVRSIAVFDLNGRRVVKANKGINIVKKVMSDGTVKTQKVVK